MFRKKMIVFSLLAVVCMATFAYCQERIENRRTSTINGTLDKVGFVGSTIVVKTNNGQMALLVPDDARITDGTKNLGLGDLNDNDSVTIQYYSPSPGQYVVVSITDNNMAYENDMTY